METKRENTYPRLTSKGALEGTWPRPACIHDPAGVLATCDICGDRNGYVDVKDRIDGN